MSNNPQLVRRSFAVPVFVLLVSASIVVAQQSRWKKGDIFSGEVVAVADGDTLTVLVDKTQTKIRLEGIDAPEASQPFGTKSKQALARKVFGKTVRVEASGNDRYGRTLGWIYLGDERVNLSMISDGWAWHFKKYNHDKALAELELKARSSKTGLWADANPLPPWEYRARQKLGQGAGTNRLADTPNDPEASEGTAVANGKFWLNVKSNVRHNARCESFANTKEGRFCGANEGKPCGKCGG